MTRFDLVHEPWVPVMGEGRRRDVSLLEALQRAHELGPLAVDDALQTVALLRQVLLPVLLDTFGAPHTAEEWAQRREEGAFDGERIAAYLARHAHRFDLFHDTTPFAQVAGLRTERDETKPVSLLLPAVAAGNNVPLFSARTEADPPSLTPAEAVRALLSGHCWDTAAIKSGVVGDPKAKAGKTTGNPTGPLGQLGVVVPIGPTLHETLMLNTPIISDGLAPDDVPQWRREPATAAWQQRPAAGLLDLLTWQSRRIRLVPETTDDGTVVVRRVVVAAGDRLTQIPVDVEPHTAWRENPRPKAGQPSVRPVRHVSGRSAWRGLAGLLATSAPTDDKVTAPLLLQQISNLRGEDYLPADYPLQVLTVGIEYGNQSAVVEDVIVDQIPLPVMALVADDSVRAVLLEVSRQAEELREAANRLGDDIRAACGADKIPWDRSQRLGDTLMQELTPVVRRMLRGLQREPERIDDAALAWRQTAHRLALTTVEPALDAAPPTAFLGRQLTERVSMRLATAERRFRAAVTRTLGDMADQDHRAELLQGARP